MVGRIAKDFTMFGTGIDEIGLSKEETILFFTKSNNHTFNWNLKFLGLYIELIYIFFRKKLLNCKCNNDDSWNIN